MIRRDQFIKKIANVNSGDYLKNEVVKLEAFVDAELEKHENILLMINSNTQGALSGTLETVQSVEQTYAIHTDPTVQGDDGEIEGRKIWTDYMFYPSGGYATNEPWASISITNDHQFDGSLKIMLPEGTNKNVAKMLADKYMDTTIVSNEPLGGCWGEGNVIVTLDKVTNRIAMTFKMFPLATAFTPTYFATESFTASCPTGKYGTPCTATATRSSKVSQEDAVNLAKNAAEAEAEASVVCTDTENGKYYSTKTATATCPDGTEGASKTATATGVGDTQEEADADANQKAMAAATAQLSCTPVWTSTQTVTVHCPEGTTGSPSTATETRKSYVSQADADQLATDAATQKAKQNQTCTNSSCTPNWQPVYKTNGCFTGMMRDTNGCEPNRTATEDEWGDYFVATDIRGQRCMDAPV
jgi:hypothetical protein